ncbi:MAG: GTP-binding protein [Hyphomicrobiales bacterium]|nr:GTP-binding protein [Hyphomicrobiales bacterium]
MIIGSVGVGKTSITHRLIFNRFDAAYKATIGVDIYTYDCPFEWEGQAQTLRMVLWDTDGDFGMTMFSTVYIKGAAAAVVVADITDPESIKTAYNLIGRFAEVMPGRPVALLLNKVDLADDQDALPDVGDAVEPDVVIRTSAKDGTGVAEAFSALSAAIRRRDL